MCLLLWFHLLYFGLFLCIYTYSLSVFLQRVQIYPCKKTLCFLCADVVHMGLLKITLLAQCFSCGSLFCCFLANYCLTFTLQIKSSLVSTPAVVTGSAVLCIMFIITASRCVSSS